MQKPLLLTILTLFLLVGSQACLMRSKSSDLFYNESSELLFRKAQAFQYKGKLDSALYYYDKADATAPNTPIILHERGLLKSNMKNYEESLIDLNKSIDLTIDQRHKEIRISNRALTYFEMNKMKEACNDWHNSGKWGKGYIDKYCK
jgi:tetratricopeptide (TPR) repeat protein